MRSSSRQLAGLEKRQRLNSMTAVKPGCKRGIAHLSPGPVGEKEGVRYMTSFVRCVVAHSTILN